FPSHNALRLICWLSAIIRDAGDQPFAVVTEQAEDIRPDMIQFSVNEELVWGPGHRDIAIHLDERAMDALFHPCSRIERDAFNDPAKVHMEGLSVPEERSASFGQHGPEHRALIFARDAAKKPLHYRQNSLLIR